jgi:uncharacterized protein (TIGR02646 family)
MKPIRKGVEPNELARYRDRFSSRATPPKWKEFKTSSERRDSVRGRLLEDQRGLCAYCEIDLTTHDQAVEHIVPAHRTSRHEDWDLRWDNLLLTCKGGTDRLLQDGGEYRYTAPPNQESCCGAHKLGEETPILTPLSIPPNASLFRLGLASGELHVDECGCRLSGVDPEVAHGTLSLLNLNCRRLRRNRAEIISVLSEESQTQTDQELCEVYLAPCRSVSNMPVTCWTAFLSTYRYFLGETAESYLDALPEYP